MSIEDINNQIRKLLDDEKYYHSIGVMELSTGLASHYGADVKKAQLAGLVHDCAKQLDKDFTKKLMIRSGMVDDVILENRGLWHGPAGSEYAKEHFEIDDEIYDAIFYHTIGKKNMPLLTKIVFLADAVEPGRDKEFGWSKEFRNLAFENLDLATLKVIDTTIISIIKRGLSIHPNSIIARNNIIKFFDSQKTTSSKEERVCLMSKIAGTIM